MPGKFFRANEENKGVSAFRTEAGFQLTIMVEASFNSRLNEACWRILGC